MAKNLFGLVHTLLDDSGALEPGGTIEVYDAGTTTPRTVYSDRGLTTTAGYQITADAAGRLPERWLADSVIVKLVYKDSAGATLATRDYANDNASGLEAVVVQYLATYAALTALTASAGLIDNGIYYTYARATEEDGGAGFWRYDSASTTTANGGTILAIDGGGAGRFIRLGFTEIDARWFGVKADGTTDDAAAMATFLTAVEALNYVGVLPVGTIYIDSGSGLSSNVIALRLKGQGVDQTIIKAGTNFAGSYLLRLQSSSAEAHFEHIAFDTTGKSARCVSIVRAQNPSFDECQFKGNQAVSLVHSTGDVVIMLECRWDVNGASTVALEWDEYNQNGTVSGGRVGGIGKGFLISRTGANDRVEGVLISEVKFINTGEYNIKVGNSLMTQIADCICDQAADYCVYIHDTADECSISDCWLGLSDSTGVCVYINSDTGFGASIDNCNFQNGATGVSVIATVSARVSGVSITNSDFAGQASQCLALDSVNGCIITGNRDAGTPSSGSWITSATHASGGSYQFDNNRWHTTAPAAFHTTSVYKCGSDTGIVWRNQGRVVVSPSATSNVVTHGLFRAPTLTMSYVNANLEGHQGDPYLTSVGSTTFTVNWTTSTTPTIYWSAGVA